MIRVMMGILVPRALGSCIWIMIDVWLGVLLAPMRRMAIIPVSTVHLLVVSVRDLVKHVPNVSHLCFSIWELVCRRAQISTSLWMVRAKLALTVWIVQVRQLARCATLPYTSTMGFAIVLVQQMLPFLTILPLLVLSVMRVV